MVSLIDFFTLLIPAVIIYAVYRVYYQVFIIGYIKRIKKAIETGEYEKAEQMKQKALKRQPKRMTRLFPKHGIN